MTAFSYVCECCGERHIGLPAIAFPAPLFWRDADATANPARNRLDSDLCVVNGEDYFIRCVLNMPIENSDAVLGWGVWLSQSKANFEVYAKASAEATPHRITFGYLANRIPDYPDTLSMEALAHWQSDGKRPMVELKETDHPLYRDCTGGITRERAIQFAQRVLHPEK
jgi:hypothetical protein